MVLLQNITTPDQWQCACDAVKHAVQGERVTLVYGVGGEDLTLTVSVKGRLVVVDGGACKTDEPWYSF
jgi:hypothetical protein